MSNAVEVTAVRTAARPVLTRVGPDADLAEERRIDNVVADDWIYGSDRSVLCPTVSDLAPADRRDDVVFR